ncbi:MAG: phosphoserine phosphatase SerB [Pseudomonadota bacterium]
MTSSAPHLATLISAPNAGAITQDAIAAAAAVLPNPAAAVLLSPTEAVDIPFTGARSDDLEDRLRTALKGAPIDIILQSTQNRAKKLFLADMDSTMIRQECIDELGAAVGLGEAIAAITERAMRGELDFEAALTERVALLKGLPEAALQEVYEGRITLTSGAENLISTLNAKGVKTVLVSGGFTFFTSRIAARLGFAEHHANVLEVENGRLTGKVIPPILGKEAKLAQLKRLSKELGLAPFETITVGDGANDAAMTEAAGFGVAFHAKQALADIADARVNYGDLTALLYILGIPKTEFAL